MMVKVKAFMISHIHLQVTCFFTPCPTQERLYTCLYRQFWYPSLHFNLDNFISLTHITIYACKTGLKEKEMARRERHFFVAVEVCARKPSGIPSRRHRCSLMSISFIFHSDRQKKTYFDSL